MFAKERVTSSYVFSEVSGFLGKNVRTLVGRVLAAFFVVGGGKCRSVPR